MYNNSIFFKFWNNTLYVSEGLSVHHQESKTLQQHQVYVIQVLWLLASEVHLVPASKQPQNLYDIYLTLLHNFRLLMMDGETVRNM